MTTADVVPVQAHKQTSGVAPVEQWLPLFHAFTDAQILNPGYALHPANGGGTWCKLCDRSVDGDANKHLRAHTRDLATHRKKQRATAAATARKNLRKRTV